MQEYIIESLQNLTVDISSIKINPRNTRAHDDKNLEAIKNSLKAYGQRKPIVVNKNTMFIEAGNGTYEAASKLGWGKIAVVLVDDDESMAKGYEVMDNRSSDLSEFDMPMLKDVLLELDSGEFDLEKMVGFDAKDMEDLMTQFHVDDDPKEETTDDLIREKFNDERDILDINQLLERYKKIIVQFSGGKDSIAMMLYLLENNIPTDKIELTICDTTMNPPGLIEYSEKIAKKFNVPLEILRGGKTEKEMFSEWTAKLRKYGYPGIALKWCNSMFKVAYFNQKRKEIINNGYLLCIGTRSEESSHRSKMRNRGVWNKMDFCFPIFNFKIADVLNILNKHKIKLHYFYKTEDRLSCFGCPLQTKRDWTRMFKFYPECWIACLKYYEEAMQCEKFINCDYAKELFKNMIPDLGLLEENKKTGLDYNLFWHQGEDF